MIETTQILYVQLPMSVVEFMMRASEDALPRETGGILIGRVKDQIAEIVHATGPGRNALHNPNRFQRDGNYAQAELDRIFGASGGEFDYQGEWHSHPKPSGPSALDCESLAEISKSTAYKQPFPLLLICERTHGGAWRVNAYRWVQNSLRRLTTRCVPQ